MLPVYFVVSTPPKINSPPYDALESLRKRGKSNLSICWKLTDLNKTKIRPVKLNLETTYCRKVVFRHQLLNLDRQDQVFHH